MDTNAQVHRFCKTQSTTKSGNVENMEQKKRVKNAHRWRKSSVIYRLQSIVTNAALLRIKLRCNRRLIDSSINFKAHGYDSLICLASAIVHTVSQESVLDEQDSQWQWYMSNESSRSALFKNANKKIAFVQIKKIITILLFCHISSTKFADTANLFRVKRK